MKRITASGLALVLLAAVLLGCQPTVGTGAPGFDGPAPIALGMSGSYVILAKTTITTTGTTAIVGDLGLSPAAASFITGFALSSPPTTYTSSALITGRVFASDYDAPTPSNLTTAVLDMEAAYTDGAERLLPDYLNLYGGNISGLTLAPGLYKWDGDVVIPGSVAIAGGPNDVWIFQVAGNLNVGNACIITLSGGAQAKNIYWVVTGQATLGTTSAVKGILLSKTAVVLNNGAVLEGRALAQTAVTLNGNAIVQPF